MSGPEHEPAVSLAKDEPPPQGPDVPGGGAATAGRDSFVSGAAYTMLAALGLVLGVVGAFNYSWSLGDFPAAAIGLAAANFGVMWLAGLGMGGKAGAAVPWGTWTAAVILLSSARSEGDLVITGDATGYLFLLGGMASGGLAIAVTRSHRAPWTWLLGGAAIDR